MKYKLSVFRHLSTNEQYVVELRRLSDGASDSGFCTKEQVGGWILAALCRHVVWPAEIEIETDLVDISSTTQPLTEPKTRKTPSRDKGYAQTIGGNA